MIHKIRKKILIVTSTFPKNENDKISARFVYDLAVSLSNFYDVHVLTPHSPSSSLHEKVDNLTIHRFRYFWPTKYQFLSSGNGLLSDLKNNYLRVLQVPLLLLAQYIKIIKIIKSNKIQTVNSHWIIPQGLVCALLKRILKFKHIITVHAADIFALKRHGLLGKYICRFILRRTDFVLPVSTYIKDQVEYVSSLTPNSKVISMGVNKKKFVAKSNTGKLRKKLKLKYEFTFLFVGKFSEKKGLKYLIKATKILKDKELHFNLLIVGGGSLYSEILNLVIKNNLEDRVIFLGWINNALLPELYSLSNVLVVPSVFDNKGETEGMPVVIQEALSCGTPVIGSDISGIPDVIKDGVNGWLCLPADYKSLANAMEKVIKEKKMDRFKKMALESSKEGSYFNISRRYKKVIEALEKEEICNNINTPRLK